MSPPLEQSVFTGTFGNPVCTENQYNGNHTLKDTSCSTKRVIILANTPSQGIDIDGFRYTFYQTISKQILDFKTGVYYITNIHIDCAQSYTKFGDAEVVIPDRSEYSAPGSGESEESDDASDEESEASDESGGTESEENAAGSDESIVEDM